ncbi:MAG: 23S rRNA (pseudouridine(1915)-N(3))-methyltransferase RlmH [Sandaracinaceae bacterium]
MKLTLVAVGKIKDRPMRAVMDDYASRIARYVRFEEIELKDAPAAELVSRFDKHLAKPSRTVALEVDGSRWSSEQLAERVGACEVGSVPRLTFLIGGSYGLPEEVSRAADERFSLGAITLPHRLARVVLAEQIYRAYTILRSEPYSH